MPAFTPNKSDSSVRFLPNLWSALAYLTTPRVDALYVASFFLCLKNGSPAMMLAFFPNRLGLPDRVTANLLDEFLLGAMATSRVAAPRVASTT
jgi:hypothetical protein